MSYNTLGKLTRQLQAAVEVTRANGFQETIRPETVFVYDRIGSLVGYQDANGNWTTQAWNYGTATPTVTAEWHADGGVVRYQYDVQGNRRVQMDELGRQTDYGYDLLNRLVRVDRPVRADGQHAWEMYSYDEKDQRIASQNVLGTSTMDYDADGNVARSVSAAGRSTLYSRTWVQPADGASGYWQKVMTDANGRSMVDWEDVHGRLLRHVDMGGHTFDYAYNRAGLLEQDGSTAYTYYGNGLLMRMTDTATGIAGYYEYDGNGNRTFEGFTGKDGAWAFQQSTGTYDALNRLVRVQDPRYVIDYEYDAMGNRIHMRSAYNDALGGARQVQDYWYQYDGMNRFVVTMGQLKDGRRGGSGSDATAYVWLGSGGDGVGLAYDMAGQRRSATYASDGHVEGYEYDANGQLTDTFINGQLRARRSNDLGGRVSRYEEYQSDGALLSRTDHV